MKSKKKKSSGKGYL